MKPRWVRHRAAWFSLILAVVLGACSLRSDPVPNDKGGTSDELRNSTSTDEQVLEAMQIIEGQVSELRGLDARQPVTKALLTTDALRQKLEQDELDDYTEQDARDELLLYVAFELMEPDVDLYNLTIDLLTEQVAGFYDPDAEEMFVVKGGREPGVMERMIYSHEYTHVLQDQHYDLQALGFTEEGVDEDEDSEAHFAALSLIEGDASLLMQQYALRHFDVDDLTELLKQSTETESTIMDSAPAVLRESLMFPYDAGFVFVTALFNDGGWSAVDSAYANPPVSTEQILHPDRYPDDLPQIVSLPPLTDTLGAGWRVIDADVLGEFGIQLYLSVHVSSSDAEEAAEGWGGDRYAVHWREDESAFVLALRLAWDAPEEATQFYETYAQFARDRFGGGPARREGEARVFWFGDDALLLAQNNQHETLILIAPDEGTLNEIHALFPEF